MVPDDFFDDDKESEKEFLDIASSLVNGHGLDSLTTVKVTRTPRIFTSLPCIL